jgi:hypothetical protein
MEIKINHRGARVSEPQLRQRISHAKSRPKAAFGDAKEKS